MIYDSSPKNLPRNVTTFLNSNLLLAFFKYRCPIFYLLTITPIFFITVTVTLLFSRCSTLTAGMEQNNRYKGACILVGNCHSHLTTLSKSMYGFSQDTTYICLEVLFLSLSIYIYIYIIYTLYLQMLGVSN